MRCLVTAGKHISNTQAIAMQLLGKRLPAKNEHACNNGNRVSYVVRLQMQ
jgi:hypothetical protein